MAKQEWTHYIDDEGKRQRVPSVRSNLRKASEAMQHVDTCEGMVGPDYDTRDKEGYDDATCSMCGATTHTERERTEDGEWDEDCVFHPFYDGDGNDLRRPGQAGR